MLKKIINKQTVVSFLVSALIFTSISVFAENDKDNNTQQDDNTQVIKMRVNPNPFPIVVNGEEKDISSYNIDGYTYLRLRGVVDAVNAEVDFDNSTKTILINTDWTPKPQDEDNDNANNDQNDNDNNSSNDNNNEYEFVPYKNFTALKYEDRLYISREDLASLYKITVQEVFNPIRLLCPV